MEMKLDASIMLDVAKGVRSVEQDEMYIRFGNGQWAVRSQGPAGAIMVASKVKQDKMDHYDKGEVDALGLDIDQITNFIQKGSKPLHMKYDYDDGKLLMQHDGLQLETGTIAEGYVSGSETNFPKIDFGMSFVCDKSIIFSMIGRAEDVINSRAFLIEGRENNMYLYANKDEKKLVSDTPWGELEDYNIDWSAEHIDSDEKRASAAFGTEFLKGLFLPDDNVRVYLADQAPIKLYSKDEDGVETTYFAAPRLPDDSSMANKVPHSVLNDEDKINA